MTAGGLVVGAPKEPPRRSGGPGTPLRIICPTYWYPQHASDTQATYVHDINRHLVRRGHSVTVVTPGDPSLSREDTFDGVRIVRFPLNLPADLTYGRVAQSRVSWLGRFARVAVMANYLEAQHRAIMAEARQLHLIARLIEPLRDMFSAIFFVTIGLLFDPDVFLT